MGVDVSAAMPMGGGTGDIIDEIGMDIDRDFDSNGNNDGTGEPLLNVSMENNAKMDYFEQPGTPKRQAADGPIFDEAEFEPKAPKV